MTDDPTANLVIPITPVHDPSLVWTIFRDNESVELPEMPQHHTTGPTIPRWIDFEVEFFKLMSQYMAGIAIAPTNLYSIANGSLSTMPMATYSKVRVRPHGSPKPRLLSIEEEISPNLPGVQHRHHGIVCDYRIQFDCWGENELDAETVLQKVKDFYNYAGDRIMYDLGVRQFYWIEDLTDTEIVRYRLKYSVRSTVYMMTIAHQETEEVKAIASIEIAVKEPDPDYDDRVV